MKEKSPQLHLIDLDEPLDSFIDLIMRCGVIIKCGQAKWMLADEFKTMAKVEESDYVRGVCRACMFLEPVGEAKRTMLYGIVEKKKTPSQGELLEESA